MHCQGKWRPSERESGGRGGEDWGDDGGHQRWEEEEVDPEDLHEIRLDFQVPDSTPHAPPITVPAVPRPTATPPSQPAVSFSKTRLDFIKLPSLCKPNINLFAVSSGPCLAACTSQDF